VGSCQSPSLLLLSESVSLRLRLCFLCLDFLLLLLFFFSLVPPLLFSAPPAPSAAAVFTPAAAKNCWAAASFALFSARSFSFCCLM
jgi:hypothetical protein